MNERDTEWALLICYARAAGAKNHDEAAEIARQAINLGEYAGWPESCRVVDSLT